MSLASGSDQVRITTAGLLTALAGLVLAAAEGSSAYVAVIVILGQCLAGVGPPLFSFPQATVRQTMVPDHVLGRVNTT